MLSTDATQGATPATTAASGVPSQLMKPWLVGLAALGLTIGVVALATSGNKKRGNNRHSPRKGKRQKPGADHAYRAWYCDSPATLADQAPTGAPYADLRYSDQNSRRIASQYP